MTNTSAPTSNSPAASTTLPSLDGRAFIAQHVHLVLAGLSVRPPDPPTTLKPLVPDV